MSWRASMQPSQSLSYLLAGLAEINTASERDIRGLTIDSREVIEGDLFLACRGDNTDGMHYIQDAIAAGAVAVVFESDVHEVAELSRGLNPVLNSVPMIRVDDLQQQLGLIASRFFSNPSQELFVIGVTGTNGKTSCCHFLVQALQLNGEKCGVIGTLGYGLPGAMQVATHTTPNPIVLQSQLRLFCDVGATAVVMEVSSHALEQARVAAVAFDITLFTNLTRDHLDYHGDFKAYGAAKQKLFEMPGLRYAVINRDDAFGAQLLGALPASVKAVAYGLLDSEQEIETLALSEEHLEVYGRIVRLNGAGIELHVVTSKGEGVLRSDHLLGEFNARNLLAVVALLLLMEVSLDQVLALLAQVRNASGRMERLGGDGVQPLVVIDYAHTPDALQNVLIALRDHCDGRLWCVFGCGGERDRGKRPLMGTVAVQYADDVIITNDNPRNEDAAAIVRDITADIRQSNKTKVIHDREAAIRMALNSATADDVVVIAGKGHETYQVIAAQKLPFSDRECVQTILQEVA